MRIFLRETAPFRLSEHESPHIDDTMSVHKGGFPEISNRGVGQAERPILGRNVASGNPLSRRNVGRIVHLLAHFINGWLAAGDLSAVFVR